MQFASTMSKIQANARRRALHSVAALAAIFLMLLAPGVWAQGAGYWHTSGNKILDANGTEVRIAGINWYGFETPDYLVHGLWAQDYHTVLNTIKSLGYNVIRIPFSNEMVESDPVPSNYTSYADTPAYPTGGPANQALVGATALQDLDTIVAYAGSIGLRVILDNHRSEAGETNEASGLWYTSAYPQANWIADWQTMATRYSASTFTFNGNPTVIGMDLRNEPHLAGSGATTGSCWTGDTATNGCPTTLTTQNWPVAATAAGNAVLAINPKLLIFIEGNDCYSGVCAWQGENLLGVANYPVTLSVANQLVYSAHDYGPNLYEQPWFTTSTTAASLDAVWNKYWGYIGAAGTAPVWLGEFGTDNTSTDIESSVAGSQGQWFQSLVAYLAANPTINWTYWALNGEDTYALLDNSYSATPVSSLKQSLLAGNQFPLAGVTVPSFTITSSASTVSVAQGGTGTATITVTGSGGFTGGVTLAASGLPSGVTATFSTNPATSTSVVTFTASTSAPQGTAAVIITGTSGALTPATANISLAVGPPSTAGFTLAPSASTLSVAQGKTATDTITVTDTGGFTGSVTLAATGLPTGVTVAYGTNPTTATSVLTFTASATATAGTSTVTITGTSGTTTAKTTISLTVTGSGFTLAPSASTLVIAQGKTATDTITVTDTGGFTGSVTLAATGLPTGVTVAYGTNPTTATSVLTFTASATATAGTSTVTITGTSGTTTATTTISLTVSAAGFTLAPSASTLAIAQGKTATDTITVTDVGGFTGSVTLAATGLPTGVTVAYGTNPTTATSVLTFTASATATAGTSTVTITGTSGTTTATTTIALTVASSTPSTCTVDYVISPQNSSAFGAAITIVNGSTAITSWTLTWTFANGQTISSLWNGIETQSGTAVTVKNEPYNGSIAAGGTLTGIGFNGTWNGTTNAIPTAISLNGTACTVN